MTLNLTPEDRECWRQYESLGRRAALEYVVHPISPIGNGGRRCLAGCGRRTYRQDGVCQVCEATR